MASVINPEINFLQVDIHVKPEDRDYFDAFPPIFKKTVVKREHLPEKMRAFAEETGRMPRGHDYLISSMMGEKIMLATPLLRYYLELGLVVTNIYQAVEYTPIKVFEDMTKTITKWRVAADSDPSKKIIADTHKTTGNSLYGELQAPKEN